jgi:hypothetical protein
MRNIRNMDKHAAYIPGGIIPTPVRTPTWTTPPPIVQNVCGSFIKTPKTIRILEISLEYPL